ncbi:uncharacterized protein LOC132973597 [Labrus mixtus]|uniref:uncharacterized protein LOC132973597 n=1 Tax=Labrus mixtus TaxID=508554 RepID=UPI0029BFE896|nr:uncharacterized protein LOC132973597 [Labrus mixtus]
MNAELIPTVIENVFSLFKTIYCMAMNVKVNKERCRDIAERVRSIERLVLQIQQGDGGQISVSLQNALMDLCSTLESVKEWMEKFSKAKRFQSFIKSNSHEEKFNNMDKKLTQSFDLLSGALLIEQRDTLNRVYDTLLQRRPPQSRPPILTSPDPTPILTAAVSPCSSMPLHGPSNLRLDWKPGFLSGNPVMNQVPSPYLQGALPHIGFSNDVLCGPVAQIVTVSTTAQRSGIRPITQITFPSNTSVFSYVCNSSFHL